LSSSPSCCRTHFLHMFLTTLNTPGGLAQTSNTLWPTSPTAGTWGQVITHATERPNFSAMCSWPSSPECSHC
jgi:hypothetical protein